MKKILGIDLGTTNSCMAILEGGEPVVVPNQEGSRITPSVVTINEDGERNVGEFAKRKAVTRPDSTAQSIKRKMGSAGKISLGEKEYTPREISAMILQKMKKDAGEYIGEEINEAVITVPAYFEDSQRQATKDAGKIAGFEVKRIINEPTAAALAYGLDDEREQTVMVYDLGGGTFDVSLLKIGSGVFEVLATCGNNRLGGDDFDEAIIDYLVEEFAAEHGINLKERELSVLQRLKENSEKAKKELSSVKKVNISIPFITEGPRNLDQDLTRAKFNQLTEHLVKKTEGPCKQVLEDAGISPADLDEVLLVGGSTRIPAVQELVKDLTGKKPHKGISPDEVVAMGAAIQGGVLSGEMHDIVLLDATPLSLGVETKGGRFTKIIDRNTTIPTSSSKTFTTAEDEQTAVQIHVLQGERKLARDNKTLGHFRLSGIPPAPRGVPRIEVTFRIDENGIVQVSAEETKTEKKKEITIESSGSLSEEEIERMIEDARRYAEQDQKRVKKIELQNKADNLTYRAEKIFGEKGAGVDRAEKEKFESLRKELENALAKGNIELAGKKINELKTIIASL